MSDYGYILNPFVVTLVVTVVAYVIHLVMLDWKEDVEKEGITRTFLKALGVFPIMLLIVSVLLIVPFGIASAITSATWHVPEGICSPVYSTSQTNIVTLDNRPVISGHWRFGGAGELTSVMYYSYYAPTENGIQLQEIPATDTNTTTTRIFEDAEIGLAYILKRERSGDDIPFSFWDWKWILCTNRWEPIHYEVHVPKGSLAFAVNLKINGGE